MVPLLASAGSAGRYLDWGVIHISLANFLIIVLMIVVFIAAILIPMPHRGSDAAVSAARPTETDDGVDA